MNVRLQYDAHQRLTNLVDAVGTSVFGYWPGGQLRFEDGPWASDTLTNTYTRGRRTALLLQQPAGSWTNAFGYDTAGRLTNVTSPAGVFGYDYRVGPSVSPALLVRKLLLPSGAYITNDFDSVGRLLFTKLHTSGAVVTNSHSYDYNIASQRLRGTLGEGSSYSYSYDPIGQLSHARFTNALGQSVSGLGRDYAYDAAWNLAWRTNGGAAQQFVVNPKNELTNSTPTVAQTYDANGNLLTREQGQWTYSYDDANQLRWLVKSNASLPEAWTELVYDGLGRLRVRREYAWIGYVEPDDPDLNAAMEVLSAMVESSSGGHWYLSNEVRYVYDGRRVIQERDTNNVPQVSYTRGRDLSGSLEGAGGIGGLLARSHGYGSGDGTWSTHNYYHADGNGNVTFLLAANQTLAARYVYDPYGSTVSQTGSLADANVYRFSSKEYHPGSGLYYYLYRWYDPGMQRWLNRDPILEAGGINLYSPFGNNPLSIFDAYGYAEGVAPPGPPPFGPRVEPPPSKDPLKDLITKLGKNVYLEHQQEIDEWLRTHPGVSGAFAAAYFGFLWEKGGKIQSPPIKISSRCKLRIWIESKPGGRGISGGGAVLELPWPGDRTPPASQPKQELPIRRRLP